MVQNLMSRGSKLDTSHIYTRINKWINSIWSSHPKNYKQKIIIDISYHRGGMKGPLVNTIMIHESYKSLQGRSLIVLIKCREILMKILCDSSQLGEWKD